MSLKRTTGVTGGMLSPVGRSPSQMAPGMFLGFWLAHGLTKFTIRLRSIRTAKTLNAIALLRQSSELVRMTFPMTLTVPVAVIGSLGDNTPTARLPTLIAETRPMG